MEESFGKLPCAGRRARAGHADTEGLFAWTVDPLLPWSHPTSSCEHTERVRLPKLDCCRSNLVTWIEHHDSIDRHPQRMDCVADRN